MTELDRLDNILSTWNRHSEISRFNSSRGTADFPCSPELREVVNTAQMVSEISGGAFDITVAPLVMAWGFGPGSTGQMIPDDEHRDEARQRVGFRKLLVTEVGLQKQHSDLEIDCSAIAKGYAVDRISELLITLGYQNHLVEIGGETRCRGYKGDGKPWRIGIQVPEAGAPASARRILRLADDAVATSGDYRNFYEHDGQRYSHTIDPRTGRPITHGLVSVTIVATTCMLADAWATACNVLGPDDAVALAREQDLCAHFIYYQEGAAKAQSISSPQFSARFEEGHQE